MSRSTHPIFEGPVAVDLTPAQEPAPDHWRNHSLLGPPLETISTIVVHEPNTPSEAQVEEVRTAQASGDRERLMAAVRSMPPSGLVTSDAGFADSPDTESILGGINQKGPDYVAVGRHGNFLLWGFAADPSAMTDVGRALFLNALAYIATFGDERPIVLRKWMPRDSLAVVLSHIDTAPAERREALLSSQFGGEVPPEVRGDREARRAWYAATAGYIRRTGPMRQGHYVIDPDCVTWEVANRDPRLLDRCVEALRAGDADDAARARRLVSRYTDVSADDLESWLAKHRDHLFFSDWAGYRFISTLEPPPLRPDLGRYRMVDGVVASPMARRTDDGTIQVGAELRITEPGGYVYAPESTDGIPVTISLPDGSPFTLRRPAEVEPEPASDGHIAGPALVHVAVEGEADIVEFDLTYQLCDAEVCKMPTTVRLSCEVAP